MFVAKIVLCFIKCVLYLRRGTEHILDFFNILIFKICGENFYILYIIATRPEKEMAHFRHKFVEEYVYDSS